MGKEPYKMNDQSIREAVKEWLKDPIAAQNKYGHISEWDTSDVIDMSNCEWRFGVGKEGEGLGLRGFRFLTSFFLSLRLSSSLFFSFFSLSLW